MLICTDLLPWSSSIFFTVSSWRQGTRLSHPQHSKQKLAHRRCSINASCIKLTVCIPSNSLAKVTRLWHLFLESQNYDATKRALEATPKGIPWPHPLTETALHQKVRDRYVAALAQTLNLQSVLSGGFSSINVIKASSYYLFHCAWCWSLLIVQIRQDWRMWMCLKLKQTGGSWKRPFGKCLSTEESSEIYRAPGLPHAHLPKSRSRAALAANSTGFSPLTQTSQQGHLRPTPGGTTFYGSGALWSCSTWRPQNCLWWKD